VAALINTIVLSKFFCGSDDAVVKYRAANVRLPKLPANKTAVVIAERRRMLRAKEAQVRLLMCTHGFIIIFIFIFVYYIKVVACNCRTHIREQN